MMDGEYKTADVDTEDLAWSKQEEDIEWGHGIDNVCFESLHQNKIIQL